MLQLQWRRTTIQSTTLSRDVEAISQLKGIGGKVEPFFEHGKCQEAPPA